MKKTTIFLALNVLGLGCVMAQKMTAGIAAGKAIGGTVITNSYAAPKSYPEVGQAIPPIQLKNIHHYFTTEANLKDFKGKHVILDFGASWCAPCFQSYPKINKLQNQFKEKLQFFLILLEDKDVKDVYNKYRLKQNLNLPVTFDSTLFKSLCPGAVPHYIWINDAGKVVAITSSGEMNEDNIIKFIQNKSFEFQNRSAKTITAGQHKKLTQVSSTPDSSTLYISKLTIGSREGQLKTINDFSTAVRLKSPNVQISNIFAEILYRLAFYNRMFITPRDGDSLYQNFAHDLVLEIADTSIFQIYGNKHRFNYFVSLPFDQRSTENYMLSLQHDLEMAFGYKAAIEEREMPILELRIAAQDTSKLITKGASPNYKGTWGGATFTNQPINKLVTLLSTQFWVPRTPIIDKTGIKQNIDLEFDALIADKKGIIRELKRHGFELVPSKKIMHAIVIRDKKRL